MFAITKRKPTVMLTLDCDVIIKLINCTWLIGEKDLSNSIRKVAIIKYGNKVLEDLLVDANVMYENDKRKKDLAKAKDLASLCLN